MIVSKQQSCSIPTKPPVFLPAWKALSQLGTQATDVVAMDVSCLEASDEFEHQIRHTQLERETVGIRDIYYNMQPTSVPAIDKGFIGKRLGICL